MPALRPQADLVGILHLLPYEILLRTTLSFLAFPLLMEWWSFREREYRATSSYSVSHSTQISTRGWKPRGRLINFFTRLEVLGEQQTIIEDEKSATISSLDSRATETSIVKTLDTQPS